MITADVATQRRQVGALAVVSALMLAAIACLNLFVAPALAPRINVRWTAGLTDADRADRERRLNLVAGEHLEGTTWAYDLADSSRQGVEAILKEAAVEDTYHLDRLQAAVSADAPRGATRIRGGLSAWRDAAVIPWVTRLAAAWLLLSGIWLATTSRASNRPA